MKESKHDKRHTLHGESQNEEELQLRKKDYSIKSRKEEQELETERRRHRERKRVDGERKGEDERKRGERDGGEWGGIPPQSGQPFDALYKPTKNPTIMLSHSDDEEQLSLHSQSTDGSETDIGLQAQGEYAVHS